MSEFEIRKSCALEAFYTGGDFRLSDDAKILYTACGGVVKAVDVANGQERSVRGAYDDIKLLIADTRLEKMKTRRASPALLFIMMEEVSPSPTAII